MTFVTTIQSLDPRRSLMAGIVWLVIALAASFAIAASVWVGRLARDNILQQHARRLALETEQLGTDVDQAVAARMDAVHAAGAMVAAGGGSGADAALQAVFAELRNAYPELGWIAATSADSGQRAQWFQSGLAGLWIGDLGSAAPRLSGDTPAFGDVALPVQGPAGRPIGVVTAHLGWHRPRVHRERLTDAADPGIAAQAVLIDRQGRVAVGPPPLLGRAWPGEPVADPADLASMGARFEQLPGGRGVLVARSALSAGADQPDSGWQVQLSEPNELVFRRANALLKQILWVSIVLGCAAAGIGALGARRLTNRLKGLTNSVAAVGRSETAQVAVPGGRDEVARLAAAFSGLLDDLRQERSELRALSSDLERRVADRTREVERLAEESRYAAIARERLKIARDLHDTLAHSMMAMLSEVRLLRRLQTRDPAALPGELARAEQVAHDGLIEARNAIAQMRVDAVRDTGLGAALKKAFEHFLDRTGLAGEFTADAAAARFGDERAEALLRIAEEALRNIERHALATRVTLGLHCIDGARLELSIEDDGVGFDPAVTRPGHYGIVGLREQAQLIGARLSIDSSVNAGTRIRLNLMMVPNPL